MLKMYLLVLTEYTNVTDGRTDTARRHKAALCIASRGKKMVIAVAIKPSGESQQ